MKQKYYLILGLILIILTINPAYACISIPKAVIYDDPACIKDTWGPYEKGYIEFSTYERNKTRIIEDLQEYKNHTYRCYVLNNQQGDEQHCQYCGIGPNATCAEFREWTKDNNVTFYDDWTCEDPGCMICHWRYVRTISLTDGDIKTIADFLANGYSVIRQTEDEYQTFLENAIAVNNNLSTCDYYLAVAHKDSWTGYIFNDESNKTPACEQAPRRLCAGGFTNIIWNDLTSAPLTVSKTQSPTKPEQLNYPYFIIGLLVVAIIIFLVLKYKRR